MRQLRFVRVTIVGPLVGALLLSELLGCGRPPAPITVDEYFARLNQLGMEVYLCELGVAPEYAQELAKAFGLDGTTSLATVKTLIAAGITRYDPQRAALCVDEIALNPASCWGPGISEFSVRRLFGTLLPNLLALGTPPARDEATAPDCSLIFTGTIANGGQCYEPLDCASNLCVGSACPGTCEEPAALGEVCGNDAGRYCGRGLFCSGDSMPGGVGICEKLGEVGSNCNPLLGQFECTPGLFCDDTSHCAKPRPIGQSCGAGCVDDAWCLHPQGQDTTCVARSDTGGPCTEFSPVGNSEQCKGNQICIGYNPNSNTPGHCGVPQDVGGPCTLASKLAILDGHPTGCYSDLLCDKTTLKCVLPPKAGEACSCDLAGPGEPCPIADACDIDSGYCQDGICQALVADGEVCRSTLQCHTGSNCFPPQGSPPYCKPAYPNPISPSCHRP